MMDDNTDCWRWSIYACHEKSEYVDDSQQGFATYYMAVEDCKVRCEYIAKMWRKMRIV